VKGYSREEDERGIGESFGGGGVVGGKRGSRQEKIREMSTGGTLKIAAVTKES